MNAPPSSGRNVCLVSGGTGGHLLPALVLARALGDRGHSALLVTEGREVEREILRRVLPDVSEATLPGGRPHRLGLPWWLLRTTLAARRLLRSRRVDSVVSTGGRPSLPMGLAARSLGLPLYLLEQNAVIGRANRWLLPWARRIYLGLPMQGPAPHRALVTGTPVRAEFGRVDRRVAQKALGLDAGAPVVLVTGGSQGAKALNTVVPQALALLRQPVQVLHLSGLGHDAEVRRAYAAGGLGLRAHVRPVALDMDRMFAAADLVICRGGGTTVAELGAVGRPAVIVPYPHHRDQQQLRNAQVLAAAGAARIVEEAQLQPQMLATLLGELLADAAGLQAMGDEARRLRAPDATARILDDMGIGQSTEAVPPRGWSKEGVA
ncbi:MAG: UDP-N-acetylglucosamine--N-acetylmuramyl-(pentapeptide) pyrophosphoryl-undecaprenol N-acetylglucosamine transferase [Planctomycetes bacterium]|nr:UDP-N-acetylglucosamine--N-acetylmuramyl-(pentapeptide) pyrophosphoryl-undecaprenol N-acetylglucosamine transferase [Planctomycetota bacterium]